MDDESSIERSYGGDDVRHVFTPWWSGRHMNGRGDDHVTEKVAEIFFFFFKQLSAIQNQSFEVDWDESGTHTCMLSISI